MVIQPQCYTSYHARFQEVAEAIRIATSEVCVSLVVNPGHVGCFEVPLD